MPALVLREKHAAQVRQEQKNRAKNKRNNIALYAYKYEHVSIATTSIANAITIGHNSRYSQNVFVSLLLPVLVYQYSVVCHCMSRNPDRARQMHAGTCFRRPAACRFRFFRTLGPVGLPDCRTPVLGAQSFAGSTRFSFCVCTRLDWLPQQHSAAFCWLLLSTFVAKSAMTCKT